MSFFISDAYAAAAPAAPAGGFGFLFLMIGLMAMFYFLGIRPQQKRQKEHQKLMAGLSKGDEVVTSGGILGRIKDVGDQFITLEVASGVDLRIQKQAVGNVLPKGTIKNL